MPARDGGVYPDDARQADARGGDDRGYQRVAKPAQAAATQDASDTATGVASAAGPVTAASRVPAGSPVAAAPHADAEPAAPAELAEAAEPRPQAIPVRLQSDLPQNFSAELLNMLYRILPLDEDVMALLDEDWRVARSTGSLSGTRSKVSFPLRYLREDGSTPVEVTLRRTTSR